MFDHVWAGCDPGFSLPQGGKNRDKGAGHIQRTKIVNLNFAPGLGGIISPNQLSKRRIASTASNDGMPNGCFIASSLLECATIPSELQSYVKAKNEHRRTIFQSRLEASKKSGKLTPEADTQALADFFSGQVLVVTGLARAGEAPEVLERMITLAMSVMPLARTKENITQIVDSVKS